MSVRKRRDNEIDQIRKANRACAVGNLMLANTKSWQEFFKVETTILEGLPRKNLRAGKKDVQKNKSKEIEKFCKKNFEGMNANILDQMYEDIKRYRGLSMPLLEFEQKYAKIKEKVLKRMPKHVTVSISLPKPKVQGEILHFVQNDRTVFFGFGKYRFAACGVLKNRKDTVCHSEDCPAER